MGPISSFQLRDVVGDCARLVFFELGVTSRQELLQRWFSSISPNSSRRLLRDELNRHVHFLSSLAKDWAIGPANAVPPGSDLGGSGLGSKEHCETVRQRSEYHHPYSETYK